MHIDYLFPIGNKNDWKWKYIPSEPSVSIYDDKNCPILDNYEKGVIRVSLYTSYFFTKRSNFMFKAFN